MFESNLACDYPFSMSHVWKVTYAQNETKIHVLAHTYECMIEIFFLFPFRYFDATKR
jgi:hypothetical protein